MLQYDCALPGAYTVGQRVVPCCRKSTECKVKLLVVVLNVVTGIYLIGLV